MDDSSGHRRSSSSSHGAYEFPRDDSQHFPHPMRSSPSSCSSHSWRVHMCDSYVVCMLVWLGVQ
ncbi:hypothetical protein F2Q70_00042186 [Brassica cretica]|uniref:Uncharacterized protein n=1 Tax=Brassica cretica TaxID=69181 RepID=A0A8S9K9M4_BRACR|nr:hypothetical protein F2Q70_00042186 [Brassica cretica]